MFPTEELLIAEIKKIRDLTDQPFGVNISLFPSLLPLPVERTLDILADQGIRILETAGRNPGPYREYIQERNFFHIHKCARLRDAVKAEKVGVDMVAVVGTECGGHPSLEEVTSLILIPEVADRIRIPLIAGGGFCDGKSLVAALALGAERHFDGNPLSGFPGKPDSPGPQGKIDPGPGQRHSGHSEIHRQRRPGIKK